MADDAESLRQQVENEHLIILLRAENRNMRAQLEIVNAESGVSATRRFELYEQDKNTLIRQRESLEKIQARERGVMANLRQENKRLRVSNKNLQAQLADLLNRGAMAPSTSSITQEHVLRGAGEPITSDENDNARQPLPSLTSDVANVMDTAASRKPKIAAATSQSCHTNNEAGLDRKNILRGGGEKIVYVKKEGAKQPLQSLTSNVSHVTDTVSSRESETTATLSQSRCTAEANLDRNISGNTTRKKRHRSQWSVLEKMAVKKGFHEFPYQWKTIKQRYGEALKYRTNVQIKVSHHDVIPACFVSLVLLNMLVFVKTWPVCFLVKDCYRTMERNGEI